MTHKRIREPLQQHLVSLAATLPYPATGGHAAFVGYVRRLRWGLAAGGADGARCLGRGGLAGRGSACRHRDKELQDCISVWFPRVSVGIAHGPSELN